jgi:selenide,water dikinase
MLRSNANAARCAIKLGARACTDVSGFGLAGHLGELLRASRVSARLELGTIPPLPGSIELLARGLRSSYHEQNRRGFAGLAVAAQASSDPGLELLFDPQTSGGLLLAVSPEREGEALQALRRGGDLEAMTIGEVTPARADGGLFEVRGRG